MPSTIEDRQKAIDRANELSAVGSQYESASYSLGPQIMEAVRADRAARGVSALSKDVGQTLGQIPTQSTAVRERAGNMVNPLEVDKITSAQRGQQLNTLGTVAAQSEYEQGTLTDIISEQSNMFKAMAAAKLAEAQRAKDEADAILQELQFNEQVRQFNEELSYKKEASKNAGSGDAAFAALVQAMIEAQNEQPAETEQTEGETNFDEDGEENYEGNQQTFSVWDSIKSWFGPKAASQPQNEERVPITPEESTYLYGTPNIPTAPKSEVGKVRK